MNTYEHIVTEIVSRDVEIERLEREVTRLTEKSKRIGFLKWPDSFWGKFWWMLFWAFAIQGFISLMTGH